ncbi:4Fe-4S binding protein [Hydrogenophaga sp. 5NK40-0174]|uniref:4Fe-4S binding protein n=1 Tax=Hydrogenophaga sp. 5NK40-0174 TaxID=3127649 RepID=UPI003105E745
MGFANLLFSIWRKVLVCLCLGLLGIGTTAQATTLTREALAAYFPEPLIVGEQDPELPVWPLFRQARTDKGWDNPAPVGYVFESLDFAPVPGFSGTPVNLLIALGPKGEFLEVKVLSQREPVFVEGLGPEPLNKFVDQYKGLGITQNIKIGSNLNKDSEAGSANVYVDGVAKATASVRIVNQSMLSAALKVARARLGFALGTDPDMVGRIKGTKFEPMDNVAALEDEGLVTRRTILNKDVEAAFKDTVGEGQDPEALADPDGVFTEMLVMHLNVPTVGRNVLPEKGWKHLMGWIEPGDHAFLVATRGRYSFVGDDYTPGAVPDRLTLTQAGLPIELRDFVTDTTPKLPEGWDVYGDDVHWRVFKVISQASLDPAQPLDFALSVTRTKGQMFPEKERKSFDVNASMPSDYFDLPDGNNKTWHSLWTDRAWEIGVLGVGLLVLSVLLARPRWITVSPTRLKWVRHAYLLYTLFFIGWFAQGQLSIVNFTALIQALLAGRSLDFFLYDPMTVLLWAFVVVTLFVWGRGTFCGWLCPFGALQEFVGTVARWVKLPQLRLHTRTDAQLKKIKYVVLAVVLAMPFVSASYTDKAVEVEPFKTAITLVFDRSWPFVLWAVGLLALSAFVYKGYCRYICPLGAGVAVLGKVRLFKWLPRRAECGQPCQTCRRSCEYQAIEAQGAIDYNECFQCLDCVVIYESNDLCTPLVVEKRKGKVIPVRSLPVQGTAKA